MSLRREIDHLKNLLDPHSPAARARDRITADRNQVAWLSWVENFLMELDTSRDIQVALDEAGIPRIENLDDADAKAWKDTARRDAEDLKAYDRRLVHERRGALLNFVINRYAIPDEDGSLPFDPTEHLSADSLCEARNLIDCLIAEDWPAPLSPEELAEAVRISQAEIAAFFAEIERERSDREFTD
jgi:hypothetical protein